jgi:hypothetical protein
VAFTQDNYANLPHFCRTDEVSAHLAQLLDHTHPLTAAQTARALAEAPNSDDEDEDEQPRKRKRQAVVRRSRKSPNDVEDDSSADDEEDKPTDKVVGKASKRSRLADKSSNRGVKRKRPLKDKRREDKDQLSGGESNPKAKRRKAGDKEGKQREPPEA